MFFWNCLAFSMIQWMLAIWSLVPLPFLNPAWTSGSSWFTYVLLKPDLENIEHYFANMWDECNCVVVWTFFGIAFLWGWNENWLTFSSPVVTAEFSRFAGISLMLKPKLQYFGHLMQRTDSLEKTLMLGQIEGRRRRWRQRMRWLDGINDSMDMSLSNLGVGDGQRSLACWSPWGHRIVQDWVSELNWTEFQPVWHLCACGPCVATILHLGWVGGISECLSSWRTTEWYLSDSYVYSLRRNWYCVLLLNYCHYFSCLVDFSLFLHFLLS